MDSGHVSTHDIPWVPIPADKVSDFKHYMNRRFEWLVLLEQYVLPALDDCEYLEIIIHIKIVLKFFSWFFLIYVRVVHENWIKLSCFEL